MDRWTNQSYLQTAKRMKTEPVRTVDLIFPWLKEDSAAWRNANLLGRICFPVYLMGAATRTMIWWVWALVFLVCSPLIMLGESKAGKRFGEWLDRIFKAAFCKKNERTRTSPK